MTKFCLAILILTFSACNEISFKEPQPKGKKILSEIPRELVGSYLFAEENGSKQDTIIITKAGYYIPSDSSKGELGDSLVLKKFKGYYFFNENESPEWLLRVVKREPNGDLSFMMMEPGEKSSFNEFLFSVNKEIEIDSVEINDEKLYQIDPSPKDLLSLIEKGYFKKKMTLKKIK